MFKFNFDLENLEEDSITFDSNTVPLASSVFDASRADTFTHQEPFRQLDLLSLLKTLPPLISFSPIVIPLSSSVSDNPEKITLLRRDLFDARFQLISDPQYGDSEGTVQSAELTDEDKEGALTFLDAPSDLIPGVYEGGLKTWECSLDLVRSLDSTLNETPKDLGLHKSQRRLLEIGCGTAVPSLYLLHRIFSSPIKSNDEEDQWTELHLQDYNPTVFSLVTVPNLLLAWWHSPASNEYRSSPDYEPEEETDTRRKPDAHISISEEVESPDGVASSSGNLRITPALVAAFHRALESHHVRIQLFSGPWDGLADHLVSKQEFCLYDVVLTSETIYRPDSLPSLLRLLRLTSFRAQQDGAENDKQPLCLVAAKVLYFGVGGGVEDFVNMVTSGEALDGAKGRVENVWEQMTGVRRRVMRLSWES